VLTDTSTKAVLALYVYGYDLAGNQNETKNMPVPFSVFLYRFSSIPELTAIEDMKRAFVILCLTVIFTCKGQAVEHIELSQGTLITSPDNEFTVRYGYRKQDKDNVLSVSNNKTGKIYKSVPALRCISLKWTPDSRTMVAVYGISGGNSGIIIHFNGSEWQPFCPDCSETDGFRWTSIIKMKLGTNWISFTLVGADRRSNATNATYYYLVSLEVNPSTRLISNHTKVAIDEAKYKKLLGEAKW
jgi:hypothetical protein